MAKTKRMTEDELISAVDAQINNASRIAGSTAIGIDRDKAQKFFEGGLDLAPMGVGRSEVVSRVVADTHGLIMPSLLRVFFGTDKPVRYEPTREEHEAYADQASDLVNYIVMKECGGYWHFRNGFSDGLLLGNGPIKHFWDKTPEYRFETYELNDEQYRVLQMKVDEETEDGNGNRIKAREIVEHEEKPDPQLIPAIGATLGLGEDAAEALLDEFPDEQVPKIHTVKVKELKSKGRLVLLAMPDEEFLMDPTATILDETCRFAAHKLRKTRSQLIEEGYDKTKVAAIPEFADVDSSTSKAARDSSVEWNQENAPDKATEYVQVFESYILIDYDGDGIAERRRVVSAGLAGKRSILANEQWDDDLPFSDLIPMPRAHNRRGRGLYEMVGDLQRIESVLLRAIMDNTYQILDPQKAIFEGSVINMDELINPTRGGVLIIKEGSTPPVDSQTAPIGPNVYPVLEMTGSIAEKRTGVSQRTQVLDPEVLTNQSATAVNAMQAAANTKVEEMARNLAEGGMQRVFRCCLRLITKYQDTEKTIRLRGKLVKVDPHTWDPEMLVTINTGLGTGSRERDLMMLGAVAQKQEMILGQTGPTDGPITIKDYFMTLRKMAEASGIQNADVFFPDITPEQLEAMKQKASAASQRPDPKAMEAQARLQMEQAKAAGDMQLRKEQMHFDMQAEAAKMQGDLAMQREKYAAELQALREKTAIQAQADRERAAQELQLMRERAAAEIQIERDKAQMQAQLRREEMALEAELTSQANMVKMAQTQPRADTNIDRPGA